MRTTTKAMVKLLGGTNSKARGFFVMERATGGIIRTRFLEWHAFVDDIDDVHAIEQFLDKTFRNQDVSASNWEVNNLQHTTKSQAWF